MEVANSRKSRDLILTWEFINSGTFTYDYVMKNVLSKYNTSPSKENFKYIINKLRDGGAISVTQPRDINGKFDQAELKALVRPEIKKVVTGVACVQCGTNFTKKLAKSKYQDLCHICTELKFMASPIVECDYCNLTLPKNKSRGHWHKIYHENCYTEYMKGVRESQFLAKQESMKCEDCGDQREKGTIKKCKSCRATNDFNINVNRKDCDYCLSPYTSTQCPNDNCLAIRYITENVAFGNAYFNATDRGRSVKARIIGMCCQVCSYNTVLQYHHVQFRENEGSDNLDNILALCPNHHQEVHKCGLDVSSYHRQVLQRLDDIKNGLISI